MNKAKVLYVSQYYDRGGTEKVMLNYVTNYDPSKIEVEFLCVDPNCVSLVPELEAMGHKVHKLKGNARNRRELLSDYNDFFKGHRYDAVHFHSLHTDDILMAYFARRYKSKAVIYHSHISFVKRPTRKHKLCRFLTKYLATYKLACSQVAGKYMYVGKFNVVNNGVDYNNYQFTLAGRDEIRSQWGIEDGTILIGNIGRLHEQKNQVYILEILKAAIARGVNAQAMLVGTGNDKEMLISKASELGVSDKLIFAGYQTEVDKYLSAFDIMVLPSLYEGLSLTLVEAQANGLPIVYAEILTDEAKILQNVQLLPLGSENCDRWVDAILELNGKRVSDSYDKLKMRGFLLEDIVVNMQKFYLDIANNKKLPNASKYFTKVK